VSEVVGRGDSWDSCGDRGKRLKVWGWGSGAYGAGLKYFGFIFGGRGRGSRGNTLLQYL